MGVSVGDAAEVAEAFDSLARMGYADVIVRNIITDQAEALACIRRLAAVKRLLA